MRSPFFAGLALAVLGVACGASGDDAAKLSLDLQVTPDPPRVGPAAVILEARDADGAVLTGATIKLEANMNHAGMVPVFASTEEVEPGRYEAQLDFTMGGDWFVIAQATLPSGETADVILDVPGVRPAGEN